MAKQKGTKRDPEVLTDLVEIRRNRSKVLDVIVEALDMAASARRRPVPP
jgi:hypothetical protein